MNLFYIELAKRFPAIRCVVQDLPGTIVTIKIPLELEGRVQCMAHDFFKEQPIKDADIYFFRWILHNWSGELSTRILRCLISALKPGARILIQDSVVPEYGTSSFYKERNYRYVFVYIRNTFFSAPTVLPPALHTEHCHPQVLGHSVD